MTRIPSDDFFKLVAFLIPVEERRKFRAFRPDIDYVGPEGSPISKLIPQEIGPVNVRPAAWIHDEAYRLGGTEWDRARADLIFLVLCVALIEAHKDWGFMGGAKRAWARYRAMTYYEAVRIGGENCFTYTSKDA